MTDDAVRLIDTKLARTAKGALVALCLLVPGVGTVLGCFAGEVEPLAPEIAILPPRAAFEMSGKSLIGRWELVVPGGVDDGTALGQTLEFTAAGELVSRSASGETVRAQYTATPADDVSVRLEMTTDGATSEALVDVTARRLVVHDPAKGALVFRRIG